MARTGRQEACQALSSVLSTESKKLAGHASGEDSFGSYPCSYEPDGIKKLERQKIKRHKRGAPISRKTLSFEAKCRSQRREFLVEGQSTEPFIPQKV